MNTFQQKLWNNTIARGVIPSLPLAQLNYKFIDKIRKEFFELVASLENGLFNETELADLFIVICNCATRNGIDIFKIALDKSESDKERC